MWGHYSVLGIKVAFVCLVLVVYMQLHGIIGKLPVDMRHSCTAPAFNDEYNVTLSWYARHVTFPNKSGFIAAIEGVGVN
jgi:hypothetical protein